MPVRDSRQGTFNDRGEIEYRMRPSWIIENHLRELYRCPFCLVEARLERFTIRRKNGEWSRECKCFECGVKFYLSSLVADFTLTQYAKWIAEYPAPAFWRRCSFDVWVKRLHSLGDSRPFWVAYHAERDKAITIPR